METLVTQEVSVVLRSIMTEVSDTAVRIWQKAHDLFMQYGLKSVSMDDIANSLGMSKKTIYQYYEDKDQLVVDVVGRIIDQNESCCDADRNRAENAVHEVFLAMDQVVEMFKSMNPSLLFDMQKYYPAAFQKFLKHKNNYLFGVIRDNINKGIQEENYRQEVNVDILARYRVESILLAFNQDFHTKVKADLGEIVAEMNYHFLYGMVSPKGQKLITKYLQERKKQFANEKN